MCYNKKKSRFSYSYQINFFKVGTFYFIESPHNTQMSAKVFDL